MASCSTSFSPSSSQCSNTLSHLMSKQMPFEFGRYDESLQEEQEVLQDDYVSSDIKTLAAKDKRLRELIPLLEAVKRVKCFRKTFLQEKAEKLKRDEDPDSSDLEDDHTTDSEDEEGTETTVPVGFVPQSFESEAELTRIELLSFIFKLWLRRIGLIRKEADEKDSSLQDFEHAIYNAQEIIKKYRNSIHKEYHNMFELRQISLLTTKSLEEASTKVLEEKEKSGFEMTEEDLHRFIRPTDRLCALLGLKLDFLDRLETIPEEHLHHRTRHDWIAIFLQNNIESVKSGSKAYLTRELLDSIGFDPLSTAVETIVARSSEGSAQHHIEPCEWAEIFLQDELKYNPLMSPLLAVKFPFEDKLTNSWFQLPSKNDEESESTKDPCHVNLMNFVTKESHTSADIQSTLQGFVSQDEANIILFHGTDHHSAYDILTRGIDLCAGRQKRDFSCGSGFYLTKSLDEAVNWAKSTTCKPAILVFQVDREYLNTANKLNLDDNEDRWREVVSSFRSGKRTAKTRKSLSSFDLIEGPKATVGTSQTSNELVLKPKPSSHQMCLISDDFAEEFHKTLHSILFLDLSST